MDVIHRNIKFLRNEHKMTQETFANRLGIKRHQLGSYEEGRARPPYETLVMLARLADVTVDSLITKDLSKGTNLEAAKPDVSGAKMRVLSITVDKDDREFIEMVPHKASAGYLAGYADPA